MKLFVSFLIIVLTSIISNLVISTTNYRGTNCSKVIEVYILAGQSNAVGYNNINTFIPQPFPNALRIQENILFWPGSNAVDSLQNAWTSLKVGASKVGKNAFGPEISFGNHFATVKPGNEIAIIKYAVGGTGIASSKDYKDYIPGFENFNDKDNNWKAPEINKPAGSLYQNLLANIKEALSSLEKQEIEFRLAGIIWMQGEHEAGLSHQMAVDYDTLLSNFISSLRNDIGASEVPVVIGQISDKWIYGDIVKFAQQKVCLTHSNTALVLTHDLPRILNDNSHYTANGMILLGSRFAKAMLQLQIKALNKN